MSLSSFIKGSLSSVTKRRVRKAQRHLRSFVQALIRPVSIADVAESSIDNEWTVIQDVRDTYDRFENENERYQANRLLMRKIAIDDRFGRLWLTPYMQRLFNDADLASYGHGAAAYCYQSGEEAASVFEKEAEARPSPFGYLCLSRCYSHRLRDDKRSIEVLEDGINNFPGNVPLTISLATAQYRLGNTVAANSALSSVRQEFAGMHEGNKANTRHLEAEIAHALEQKLSVRPRSDTQDTYDEQFADAYWNRLWLYMVALNRYQHGWSGLNVLYQEQIDNVLTVAPEIRSVINFGVLCGLPDYELARKHSSVHFYGIDREKRTKELNDLAFREPNLTFLAANTIEVLPDLGRKHGPSLLFHARTGTLCYPEFLRQFYRTCAESGVAYIALWENNSLSRSTLQFHDFSDMPSESIPYTQAMFIHNYEKLLGEAGYALIQSERRPSNLDLLEADSLLADGHVFLVAKLQ